MMSYSVGGKNEIEWTTIEKGNVWKNDTKIRREKQNRNSELCPQTREDWFENFIKTLILVLNIKNKFILACIKIYQYPEFVNGQRKQKNIFYISFIYVLLINSKFTNSYLKKK